MKFLIENWHTIAAVLGFLGSPIAYLLGKKERKAKTQIVQGDAISGMQKVYDAFVEDHRERYNELKDDVRFLKEEMKVVKMENIQLRQDQAGLKADNKKLKQSVKDWENKYNGLKSQFVRLKNKYEAVKNTSSDGS